MLFIAFPRLLQEHMTEGASNGGNHSLCKFAKHDLIRKTAKWVLIELRETCNCADSALFQ